MIPLRRANPAKIIATNRTFFITSSISKKRNLLQSDRSVRLFIDVLYHYRAEDKYLLHSFVVMPDHFHALITVGRPISIERAVQLIKGGFAFRAGQEFGFKAPVWERGFSEVRVNDAASYRRIREYIEDNPVKCGFVQVAAEYPYCSCYPGFEVDDPPQGLKPQVLHDFGTAEAVP